MKHNFSLLIKQIQSKNLNINNIFIVLVACNSMWVPKGAALIRRPRLFEARRFVFKRLTEWLVN